MWRVRLFYGTECNDDQTPGELALEIVCKTDQSLELELTVANLRPEIGVIDVESCELDE